MAEKKNVRIRLFKDNSRYKGDLFVSVNGVNYKIRRGVEVEVPPEVAEVLEHSQMQDELTAARIAMHTTMWAQTLHGTTACRTTMCCWHRHLLMRCIRIICVP